MKEKDVFFRDESFWEFVVYFLWRGFHILKNVVFLPPILNNQKKFNYGLQNF